MVHKCTYGRSVTAGSTERINCMYAVLLINILLSNGEYRHSSPPCQKPCQPTANQLALTSHFCWHNCPAVVCSPCSCSTQSTAMHSQHAKLWHVWWDIVTAGIMFVKIIAATCTFFHLELASGRLHAICARNHNSVCSSSSSWSNAVSLSWMACTSVGVHAAGVSNVATYSHLLGSSTFCSFSVLPHFTDTCAISQQAVSVHCCCWQHTITGRQFKLWRYSLSCHAVQYA